MFDRSCVSYPGPCERRDCGIKPTRFGDLSLYDSPSKSCVVMAGYGVFSHLGLVNREGNHLSGVLKSQPHINNTQPRGPLTTIPEQFNESSWKRNTKREFSPPSFVYRTSRPWYRALQHQVPVIDNLWP
jgi:hypothetical protein